MGNLLAAGVKRAAAEVGQGSEKWAIHVKGMEQSAYDTHSATSMLLAYMTADVGAHHNRAWAITYDIAVGRDKVTPEKAAKVIELQHVRPLMDTLGCCRLQWVELGMPLEYYAPALTALTGVEYSWENLLHAEPIVLYHRAQARLEADQQAYALLERLTAAQADLRMRQSRGMLTQADVANLRMLQREAQSKRTIMDYAEAQQAALAYLPEVNQEISQLLGVDFASLAGPGSC